MKKIFLLLTIICCFLVGCGKEVDPKNISKDEYDKINIGDSVFTVDKIVGGGGETISESTEGKVTTYVRKYEGESKGSATITFVVDLTNGLNANMKVTGKSQDGLK